MSPEQISHEQYEQELEQHRRLRARLDETAQAIGDLVACSSRVHELVAGLSQQVLDHFAAEERGGYFRELVEQNPHIETNVRKLLDQHGVLAERLKALAAQTSRAGPSNMSADAFQTAFLDFSKRLLAHEHAENALIQDVYTQDIGSKD